MILRNGSNQQFNSKGVLNFILFEEYVFDLSAYLQSTEKVAYKTSDRFLHELIYPDTSNVWDRRGKKSLLAEGHYRISSPIYTITFMALALYGVLGGSFSRVGYTRRIVLVAATAGVVRILGFAIQSASAHSPSLNVLQYVLPIAPIVFVCVKLYGRPARTREPTALTPLTVAAGRHP
jgi:lipopolysaccharide export system permease protein